jgi:hypothetical protein
VYVDDDPHIRAQETNTSWCLRESITYATVGACAFDQHRLTMSAPCPMSVAHSAMRISSEGAVSRAGGCNCHAADGCPLARQCLWRRLAPLATLTAEM